jgi:hypothetical protein
MADMQDQPTGGVGYEPAGMPMSTDAAKGLVGSLFDFSFKAFVTPKVIQIIFILMLILLVLWTVAIISVGFAAHTAVGVIALLLSPVIYLVGVLFVRIYLELIIVLFRIYETLRDRPL